MIHLMFAQWAAIGVLAVFLFRHNLELASQSELLAKHQELHRLTHRLQEVCAESLERLEERRDEVEMVKP